MDSNLTSKHFLLIEKEEDVEVKRKYKKLYILKNDMTLEDCLLDDNINLELKIEVD